MILALIFIPMLAGLLSFELKSVSARRVLLLAAAVAHGTLTALTWLQTPEPALGGWLLLDAPGQIFLSLASALFLGAAIYGVDYLQNKSHQETHDRQEGFVFDRPPEAVFIGCQLLFLAAMTVVTLSQHFGLLWIAVEATTLASAPLIYFHRNQRSLEATWKYLLVCSVGIALALLGNFFLGVAASHPGGEIVPMTLPDLLQAAPAMQVPWLKAAFVLLLVGYGTKMGLAPLHTWLPDAHSEAPSMISALLSGALLNCAFLGILRAHQLCVAAGLGEFSRELLLVLGLASMGVAAVFILKQTDFKRLLAYSSVEHVGILALGVGLGGSAVFGSMFHAVNHSFTKAMLFMVAGNILATYQTKTILKVRGVKWRLPISGVLWIAGFLAITGTPPFGTFLSEFTILKAALEQGRYGVGIAYLALLALIFIGMATAVLGMAQGKPEDADSMSPEREHVFSVASPMIMGAVALMLGLYIPPALNTLLHEAARMMGGS